MRLVHLPYGLPARGSVQPAADRLTGVTQLPALTVLGVAAIGLVLAAAVDWQLGSFVLGLALLVAAGLRLALPPRSAGWLAVRTRGLDAALLMVLGFAVMALANTIPRP